MHEIEVHSLCTAFEDFLNYMEAHYHVRSLKELPDAAAMERVYRYVASLKKEIEAGPDQPSDTPTDEPV